MVGGRDRPRRTVAPGAISRPRTIHKHHDFVGGQVIIHAFVPRERSAKHGRRSTASVRRTRQGRVQQKIMEWQE